MFKFEADPSCKTLEIPVLFQDQDPSSLANAYAYSHNFVNCLVDGNTVFTAKSFGPEVDYLGNTDSDILGDYVEDMFEKIYTNINYADERDYHEAMGSIHCATNAQREIPSYDWWKK